MIKRQWWVLLLVCVAATACASTERQYDARRDIEATRHQLLVMLRMPAPHFRPDVTYGSGYGWGTGQDARRRTANALAAQYGLSIVDAWPMPALGVECFVMQTPDRAALGGIVERLAADSRVESAQPINVFHALPPAGRRNHLIVHFGDGRGPQRVALSH